MFPTFRVCLSLAFFLPMRPLLAEETKGHITLSFDDKGKLEDANAWKALKNDMANRKVNHVFLLAHGWRTSKAGADATFSYFGKHLREQGKDEEIEVIGIRWPSLIGENDAALDVAFKLIAKRMASAIAESNNINERKATLKKYLKSNLTRFAVAQGLNYQLPPDDQVDALVDNFDQPENVEKLLSIFSYYEMKRRANVIGAAGVAACLSELQEAAPTARVHLVGHSFGCKVWLSCLACEGRADKQVDSLTLLQGAVSTLCFAPMIKELDGLAGAYADLPKRVKGPISITFTKNDSALAVAYLAASQAAGQVAELPARRDGFASTLYGALGAKGFTGTADAALIEWDATTAYKLRPGFNALNADKVIQGHEDYRREEVTKLIWSAARLKAQ